MKLELASLHKALGLLRNAISVAQAAHASAALTDNQREVIRAGVIQNFEFTYELCWKFMKRWLENNVGTAYVDGVTRRELFRLAGEHKLIEDVERWMDYHDARNRTAHTYDEDIAQEIFDTATGFAVEAASLVSALESRNA